MSSVRGNYQFDDVTFGNCQICRQIYRLSGMKIHIGYVPTRAAQYSKNNHTVTTIVILI